MAPTITLVIHAVGTVKKFASLKMTNPFAHTKMRKVLEKQITPN